MPGAWTTRRMLAWMAEDLAQRGVASARLDAELLLAAALGCARLDLYLDMDRPLGEDDLAAVRERVRRRRLREPVAYILGRREFWGRPFEVNADVLVPRPETELLVELALAMWGDESARALDLCTGSGAVAVSLAAERTAWLVDASDVSEAALAVARRNVAAHGLEARVRLHAGDLFLALGEGAPYDVITANPPYIAEAEWNGLPPEVRDHEPGIALFGGVDGLDVVRRIVAGAGCWLVAGGRLLIEVGAGQAAAAARMFAEAGFDQVATHRDLAGIERVVSGTRRE